MSQDPRAEIEAALRRLPIRPSAQGRVPGLVAVFATLMGKANVSTPPRFRGAGRAQAERELRNIAGLATGLAEAIDTAHEPTIIALANRGVLRTNAIGALRTIAQAATEADVSAVAAEKPTRGRPRHPGVGAIAIMVASTYRNLTGKKPTRTTNWDSGEIRGPFFELMRDMFKVLEVRGSPEVAVRKICGEIKRRKTPKKN